MTCFHFIFNKLSFFIIRPYKFLKRISFMNGVNLNFMSNLLITIFNLNGVCMKKGISSSDLMFRA